RYGDRAPEIARWLASFPPQALRDWAHALGVETFVGSSGRVFPVEMKAAPLLRAWLHRLRAQGLRLHARHRWQGWRDDDATTLLRFTTPQGPVSIEAKVVVLALGGASWPQLGSNGAWVPWLNSRGVQIAPLQAANCGFDVETEGSGKGWSPYFAQRFAGAPMKSVRLHFRDGCGPDFDRQGEFVITATGIEGSLVYGASSRIRNAIERDGHATVQLDLVPGRSLETLGGALARDRATRSLPRHLKQAAGLDGVKAALLRERFSAVALADSLAHDPLQMAADMKSWPLKLVAARPVAEAISTAGGVRFDAIDERCMLRNLPGVFCAGEMLDWEAPTGGYLLSACLASGVATANGVLSHLGRTI
ncbi:MAG: TIGR03862 family flavoprotein, partial [Burkholderiales bacterium]